MSLVVEGYSTIMETYTLQLTVFLLINSTIYDFCEMCVCALIEIIFAQSKSMEVKMCTYSIHDVKAL